MSGREVKNGVWMYLQTIVMGLYAVSEQKLAHPNRALSLHTHLLSPAHPVSALTSASAIV